MSLINNILELKKELPSNIKLVAVSKTKSKDDILTLYNSGHYVFGENKVQELTEKYEYLPKDIEWHFIGHLQTNKVKFIAPFISLVHSIDSLKLLEELNYRAFQNNRVIDCLFEVYIAQEETKFGLNYSEICQIIENDSFNKLKNIRIIGLMGMASFSNDKNQIINEFKNLYKVFTLIKSNYFSNNEYFKELSMGMSGDFQEAIKCGATIVRIGSLIFK
jgi:pyridoxal phosphate enzyme (YggS family)